jgi:drug/metabolite transporter (DMT)-like permease
MDNKATYARLLAVPAIWGGTFIAGRIVALALPATVAAALRFVIASVALLVMVRILEGGLPRLDRRQVLATLLLGATGVFAYNLFFLGALSRLPASRTSLIIALNPIVTIAVDTLLSPAEKLGPKRWLGVGLALFGVWIVIARGDLLAAAGSPIGTGELLMFGGVCAWTVYTLIGRHVLAGLSPLGATTWAALWGTLLLIVVAAFDWRGVDSDAFTLPVVSSLVYLGVLGTAVAFVWYYRAVKALGAARTVIFNNLVPVFGATFGVLLLGEPVSPSLIVGGVIALSGVMLVTRP